MKKSNATISWNSDQGSPPRRVIRSFYIQAHLFSPLSAEVADKETTFGKSSIMVSSTSEMGLFSLSPFFMGHLTSPHTGIKLVTT